MEFLSADMDKEVITTLQKCIMELMAMTSSSTYKKHVTIDQGKQVLYVSLKKALYR